ncbi:TPA: hypothetical protein SMV75_000562 [Proteus mirabilis]|nr:hypothetical protein [Proteus mirabilis]MBG5962302.1 hypothetical protein [Proteus mirabilis]SUC06998.1 Uncharacterised protein [Proteus mirabilis]HCT7328993.1 hypothetical protein [Proteus mirabilis]HEJ9477863.1 hypothetical protein [Proteus mirabilis]HEK0746354.1 hypothetical protein [Proteus mirabilis]
MPDHFITLLVVIITGAISVVGLVISKENKISEFRQSWINDLRDSLSQLSAQFYKINSINKLILLGQKPSLDDIYELNLKKSEVLLRINNGKKKHENKDEDNLIKYIDVIYNKLILQETYDIETDYTPFIDSSSSVLKNEWERVKKGELKYVILTYFFGALFLITLIIFSIYIYYNFNELADLIKGVKTICIN